MRLVNYFSRPRRDSILALLAFLVISTIFVISSVGAASTDDAKDGRLVTFHDRGQEKVILTHAQSVRDALSDADIHIAPEDRVEPSLEDPLVATDYTVNIYRARPVIVIDGAIRQKIMTAQQTASGISDAAGIKLHDEDTTRLGASDNVIADGASVTLTIDRATAFTLNLYGTTTTAYSRAATVGEMLQKKNIHLAADDSLSVDPKTPLTGGMTVEIWRNGVQTSTVEEPIAFPVRQIQDADQPTGYRKIQTPGTKGRKNVTYEITMQNGKEVSRKMIQSVTLEEPKEQVEIVGSKPSFSGDFAAALAKLRSCEGGYNSWNPAGPYYGAYQFNRSTWNSVADPAKYGNATPAEQDEAARKLYLRRGWQPWPNCGAGLPDTYR